MYHSTSSFLYVPGTRDHDTQKQKAAPDWRLHQLCCWTNRLYVDRKTPVIGHGYCPKHVLGDPPNRQKETRNLKMRRRVQANFGSGKKPWHHIFQTFHRKMSSKDGLASQSKAQLRVDPVCPRDLAIASSGWPKYVAAFWWSAHFYINTPQKWWFSNV